jgi:hypothetical protein
MDLIEKRYWPFDTLIQDKPSEQHRREISFLETAFRAGYESYTFGFGNFGAKANEKTGEIIYRGSHGKHWEVFLSPLGLSAHLDHFDSAAEAVLRWLRGIEATEIMEYVRGHLVVTRATTPGFRLHNQTEESDSKRPHADGLTNPSA